MPQSFRSVVLEEVRSTNTEAFARATAGEVGPLWIVARRQTEGRGRSGRRWVSEPGNLYASLLQTFACPPSIAHQLSLLAGVATLDAIRAAAGATPIPGLRLKWPNDVLIGEAKCAGILAESVSGGSAGEVTAVIGVGLNLAWHPADLGRAATHLAAHGVDAGPDAMLAFLAHSMQRWVDVWGCGAGFAEVRRGWLERAGPIGERITANTGQERIEGTFLGLDAGGALVLRDAHGLQRELTYGDVSLAPAATQDRG